MYAQAQQIDWNNVVFTGVLVSIGIVALWLIAARSRAAKKAEAEEWDQKRADGHPERFANQPNPKKRERKQVNAAVGELAAVKVDPLDPATMMVAPAETQLEAAQRIAEEEAQKRREAEAALAEMRERAFKPQALKVDTIDSPPPIAPPPSPVPAASVPVDKIVRALQGRQLTQSVLAAETGLAQAELVPALQALMLDTRTVGVVDVNAGDPVYGLTSNGLLGKDRRHTPKTG